jgi:acyl carrier protein
MAELFDRPELAAASPECLLVEDLGFDSLALAEIVIVLEGHTRRVAEPELIESLRTVSDLLAWFGGPAATLPLA